MTPTKTYYKKKGLDESILDQLTTFEVQMRKRESTFIYRIIINERTFTRRPKQSINISEYISFCPVHSYSAERSLHFLMDLQQRQSPGSMSGPLLFPAAAKAAISKHSSQKQDELNFSIFPLFPSNCQTTYKNSYLFINLIPQTNKVKIQTLPASTDIQYKIPTLCTVLTIELLQHIITYKIDK